MKQKLIKIAVWFLGVMAAFTMLSRAAYNVSTPKVVIGEIENMEMGPEVTGSGIVEARKEIPVTVEAQQLIRSVDVIAGEEVQEGDVLFELDKEQLAKNVETKEQELASLKQQIQNANNASEVSRQTRELSITQAETDYQRAVKQGNQSVGRAEEDLQQAKNEYQSFLANPSGYPGRTEEEFAQRVEEMQSAYDAAVDARDESIYQAQKAVDMANLPIAEDGSAAQMEVERQAKEKEITRLKALQEQEGLIKSPANGVIYEVNIKPGAMTTGTGDILLSSEAEGLVLKAQFPEEQKEYLVRGAKVRVFSEAFTESELNKLGDLKINSVGQTMDGMGYEVNVFLEDGSIPIGTMLSMQIQTEKKTYDSCLPLEALHQEEEGKYFVYTLDETQSVLGDEKVARKVDVTVEYKGDLYVAVEGLSVEQQVIISSTKELKDGGRVKPQEQ